MSADDDWETDPDYENKITEEEQRWGVGQANHRSEAIDMRKLIEETGKNDAVKKQQLIDESGITGSKGYGGKFGVEKDRMDKSAMGHNFIGKAEKHASQITSTGFGGKFGVEKDRMDKSAVGFSESVGKIGTNYCPIKKPDILGAKPASYRSKFENLQVHNDAESKERAAEQRKLREEKDKLDREQALKEQSSATNEPSKQAYKPQRAAVVTGKSGKISDVINVFNAPTPAATVEETNQAPRKTINIPKEFTGENNDAVAIDDAHQAPRKSINIPKEFTGGNNDPANVEAANQAPRKAVNIPKEFMRTSEPVDLVPEKGRRSFTKPDIIPANEVVEEVVEHIEAAKIVEDHQPEIVEDHPSNGHAKSVAQTVEPELAAQLSEQELIEQLKNDEVAPVEEEEQLQQQQFVLSPDDPGIIAYALYDYQAAAEDEISFDPGDVITHIEMIDEGWWKGLHQPTLLYGLFPANYVQLKE